MFVEIVATDGMIYFINLRSINLVREEHETGRIRVYLAEDRELSFSGADARALKQALRATGGKNW